MNKNIQILSISLSNHYMPCNIHTETQQCSSSNYCNKIKSGATRTAKNNHLIYNLLTSSDTETVTCLILCSKHCKCQTNVQLNFGSKITIAIFIIIFPALQFCCAIFWAEVELSLKLELQHKRKNTGKIEKTLLYIIAFPVTVIVGRIQESPQNWNCD